MSMLVSRQAQPADSATLAPLTPHAAELEARSKYAMTLAKSDLLPKEFQGKPANVLIVMGLGQALGLSAEAALYGMHVIEGRPNPSAKLQAALVRRAGHKLRVLERTDSAAECEIVRADDPDYPTRVRYTLDDAVDAGMLDEWVERWNKTTSGKNFKEVFRLPLVSDAPEWAVKAVASKQTKRKDNWHGSAGRRSMLWHRAVTECVGAACPEVLSGLDFDGPAPTYEADDDDIDRDPVAVVQDRADTGAEDPGGDAPSPPGQPADDDVVDAEIIDDEPEQLQLDDPITVAKLKGHIQAHGLRMTDVIKHFGASHDVANLTAICDDQDLAAVVWAWVADAGVTEEPF